METTETITANKGAVLQKYSTRGKKFKKELEELFGREVFLRPIMERIATFQDALDYKGETMADFNKRTEHDEDHERAYKELVVISYALNEGKTMTYADASVYKYYPWFNSAGSGSGFSFCCYACVSSVVGARLCVDTREKATYMGKQFIAIYNRYING